MYDTFEVGRYHISRVVKIRVCAGLTELVWLFCYSCKYDCGTKNVVTIASKKPGSFND